MTLQARLLKCLPLRQKPADAELWLLARPTIPQPDALSSDPVVLAGHLSLATEAATKNVLGGEILTCWFPQTVAAVPLTFVSG